MDQVLYIGGWGSVVLEEEEGSMAGAVSSTSAVCFAVGACALVSSSAFIFNGHFFFCFSSLPSSDSETIEKKRRNCSTFSFFICFPISLTIGDISFIFSINPKQNMWVTKCYIHVILFSSTDSPIGAASWAWTCSDANFVAKRATSRRRATVKTSTPFCGRL